MLKPGFFRAQILLTQNLDIFKLKNENNSDIKWNYGTTLSPSGKDLGNIIDKVEIENYLTKPSEENINQTFNLEMKRKQRRKQYSDYFNNLFSENFKHKNTK